jgi:hypothetical protein
VVLLERKMCGLVIVECGLRLRGVRNGYVKGSECVSVSGITVINLLLLYYLCVTN